jgi:hypothetical protein
MDELGKVLIELKEVLDEAKDAEPEIDLSFEDTAEVAEIIMQHTKDIKTRRIKWEDAGFELTFYATSTHRNASLDHIQKSLPPWVRHIELYPDQDQFFTTKRGDLIEATYIQCTTSSFLISTIYDVRITRVRFPRLNRLELIDNLFGRKVDPELRYRIILAVWSGHARKLKDSS